MRRAETVAGVPAGTRAVVREGLVMSLAGRRPVGRGGYVRWEGQRCRVVQRRRVSGLAFLRTGEFELLLEAADGGSDPGWVAENEVEPDAGDAGNGATT